MFGTGVSGLVIKQELTVEGAFQDGLQALIGIGLELDGPLAGGLQPGSGIDLLQPQDTQAGAVAHFRVRFPIQDSADHLRSRDADPFGPVNQPRGRPFQMRLMTLGHVFGYGGVLVSMAVASMRGDPFAAMKDLHRGGGETGVQLLTGKLIGNAVIVTVYFDVVIDGGTDGLPMGQDVSLGGQWLRGRAIQFGKQARSRTFAFSEWPLVELFDQFGNGFVLIRANRKTCDGAG